MASTAVFGQSVSPSEFLPSFLSRPQLLSNSSNIRGPSETPDDHVAAFTVYVANWSPYRLVYSDHRVVKGILESSYPPRNMPQKLRGFAAR